jgi:TolB protein
VQTTRFGPYEQYELGASVPAWSPDGRSIAFAGTGDDDNVDVYIVRADGHGKRRLTRHPAAEGNPAWSPDGRQIAFTRGGPGFQTHIYVMNADGTSPRRLTRHGHIHFSVVWSPDGRKMLFERPNRRHAESAADAARGYWPEELYVMDADGSHQRRLTRNPARDPGPGGPVWSPDGRQIAFTRSEKTGHSEVFVMNAKGNGQRSLTPARPAWGPAWSSDGREIAFADGRRSNPPAGIVVMNAEGSEQQRLTQHGGEPAWSPDGKMIAFEFQRSLAEHFGLRVMNADGSGERTLLRSGVQWIGPFSWSPTLPKRP